MLSSALLKKTKIVIILLLFFSPYVFNFLSHPFQFISIAHRGASGYAPENTFAAFNKALELGFDYIEFDIRISRDGQFVVMHDETVNRTTDGEGYVKDMSVSELKQLDAGSWFSPSYSGERIPLLTEVLDEYGGKIGLLVELKSPEEENEIPEALARLLMQYVESGLPLEQVLVQSFNAEAIKKFTELAPDISAGIIISKPLDVLTLAAYSQFAQFLSVHHYLLTASFISQAEHHGFTVFTWTVKKKMQFNLAHIIGVHGIISDRDWTLEKTNIYGKTKLAIREDEDTLVGL